MPVYFFTDDFADDRCANDDSVNDHECRGRTKDASRDRISRSHDLVTRPYRSLIAIIDPCRDVCQMRATWVSDGRSISVSATTRASVFDALRSVGRRGFSAVLWLPHTGGDIVLEHARVLLGDVVPIVVVVPRLIPARVTAPPRWDSTILVEPLVSASLPREVSGALDALTPSSLATKVA